jgi:hypothetical protein
VIRAWALRSRNVSIVEAMGRKRCSNKLHPGHGENLEFTRGVLGCIFLLLTRVVAGTLDALMSTPDALPMEISLIVLYKLQVYLTFLHHYFHRPITLSIPIILSVNYTPHGIDQHPVIKFFLSTRLAPYTHSIASHNLSYPEFNCNNFLQLLSVSPSFFSLQSHTPRVMGPT